MVERCEVVAIVVNFRQAAATRRCVGQLRARAGTPLDVLVVDNGPEAGAQAGAEAGPGRGAGEAAGCAGGDQAAAAGRAGDWLAGTGAELLVLPENLGYCAAINRGLRAAREHGARFVLLANNDIECSEGFLVPMLELLRHAADVAGVMPTILRPDGRVWSQGGRVGLRPNLVVLEDQGREPAPVNDGPLAVGFLPGACALYRLEDLKTAGDLDESYFMYWEDTALGTRLASLGRKLVWLPWVRVVHQGGLSSGGPRSPLRKYLCAVNSWRWLRAHGRARHWAAFLLLDVLLWPLALVGGARGGWAKVCGLWDGWRGVRPDRSTVERWLPRA